MGNKTIKVFIYENEVANELQFAFTNDTPKQEVIDKIFNALKKREAEIFEDEIEMEKELTETAEDIYCGIDYVIDFDEKYYIREVNLI